MEWQDILVDVVLSYCPIREAMAISILNRTCMMKAMRQDPYKKRLLSYIDLGLRITSGPQHVEFRQQQDKEYRRYVDAKNRFSSGRPVVLFHSLL